MAKRRSKKRLVRLPRAKGKLGQSESQENNLCQMKNDLKSESNKVVGHIEIKGEKHGKENSEVTDVKLLNKTMSGRKYISRKLKRKPSDTGKKKTGVPKINDMQDSSSADSEEVFLQTRVEDGMTCMDVECGPNQAVMDPAKLCVGSKGACIRYMDAWLTPNEFQLVSGRETAKDWKRSIKHNGKSLKLLIANGLLKLSNSKDGKKFKGVKKLSKIKLIQESVKAQSDYIKESEDIANDNEVYQGPTAEEVNDTAEDDLPVVKVPDEDSVCGILLEKSTKKRPGRKSKKSRSRAIQNVPLPDGSSNQDGNTKHESDVPLPDGSSNQDGNTKHKSDPPAPTTEVEEAPAETQSGEAESSRSSPLPLPTVDSEIKSEEEKRLDEFVKVLSLNKTTEKADPCATTPQESVPSPRENSEMPILKMEMDVDPPDLPMQALPVDTIVNPFHATVTPPPTPPTDSPEHEDLMNKHGDNIDAFKARLSPIDDGFKLVINRQSVKNQVDVIKVASPTNAQDTMKAKDMLFDALTSARKFKEQLRNQYERQSVIHVPRNNIVAQKQSQGTKDNVCVNDSNKTYNNGTHIATNNSEKKSFMTVHDLIAKDIKRTFETDSGNGSPPARASSVQPDHNPKYMEHHRSPPTSGSGNSKLQRNAHISRPCLNPSEAAGSSSYLSGLMTSRTHIPGSALPFHPSPMTTQMFLALSQQLYQNMYVPPLFPYSHMSTEDVTGLRSDGERRKETASTARKRKLSDYKEPACDAPLDLSMKKAKHDYEFRPEAVRSSRKSELTYTPCSDYTNESHVKHGYKHSHEYMPTYFTDNYLSRSVGNEHPFYYPDLRKPDWTFGCTSVKEGFRQCTCSGKQKEDIRTWSVDRVCSFLRGVDGCKSYTKTFHDQGINGRLLPYLTTQHLTRTLGMKVGPALSLQQAVDQLLKNYATFHPCTQCRSAVQ